MSKLGMLKKPKSCMPYLLDAIQQLPLQLQVMFIHIEIAHFAHHSLSREGIMIHEANKKECLRLIVVEIEGPETAVDIY